MAGKIQKRFLRSLCVAVGVVGLCSLVVWQVLRPKIGHATLAEIRRFLPPDLRAGKPIDQQAVDRMQRFLAVAHRFALADSYTFGKPDLQSYSYGEQSPGPNRDLNELTNSRTPEARRLKVARHVWETRRRDFEEMKEILDEGGLEFKHFKNSWTDKGFAYEIRDVVRCLRCIGSSFAQSGDFKGAVAAVELGRRIGAAVEGAGGDSMLFLEECIIISEADYGIRRVAGVPGVPSADCKRWLDDLTELHKTMLAEALAIDFRENMLPMLADPARISSTLAKLPEVADSGVANDLPLSHESYLGYGTYDPFETARLAGQVAEEDIKATLGSAPPVHPTIPPMPEYHGGGMEPGIKLSWEKLKFHYMMSNSYNTLGRGMLQLGSAPDLGSKIALRDACLARREMTRIMLACILYRRSHSGRLPSKLSDLAPEYLNKIPHDPFTGTDIKFNSRSGLISCDSSKASFDHDGLGQVIDFGSSEVQVPKGP